MTRDLRLRLKAARSLAMLCGLQFAVFFFFLSLSLFSTSLLLPRSLLLLASCLGLSVFFLSFSPASAWVVCFLSFLSFPASAWSPPRASPSGPARPKKLRCFRVLKPLSIDCERSPPPLSSLLSSHSLSSPPLLPSSLPLLFTFTPPHLSSPSSPLFSLLSPRLPSSPLPFLLLFSFSPLSSPL